MLRVQHQFELNDQTVITQRLRFNCTCVYYRFWYYMYGDGMGELNVYVHNNSYKNLVWSSTDNGILQQKNWNMATINNVIITLPVSGSSYRVSCLLQCHIGLVCETTTPKPNDNKIMHSFLVNVRICQPKKEMSTLAKPSGFASLRK